MINFTSILPLPHYHFFIFIFHQHYYHHYHHLYEILIKLAYSDDYLSYYSFQITCSWVNPHFIVIIKFKIVFAFHLMDHCKNWIFELFLIIVIFHIFAILFNSITEGSPIRLLLFQFILYYLKIYFILEANSTMSVLEKNSAS